MRSIGWIVIVVTALVHLVAMASAIAQDRAFGSFILREADPDAIEFGGVIDAASIDDFNKATASRPSAKLLLLNGEGTDVDAALAIAEATRSKGLDTFVAPDAFCHDACAIALLGGRERVAEGELVLGALQRDGVDVGAVVGRLAGLDVPSSLIAIMLRADSGDRTPLSREEKIKAHLLPAAQDGAVPQAASTPPAAPQIFEATGKPDLPGSLLREADLMPQQPQPPAKPARLVIWSGLDIYGGDMAAVRTDDLAACASGCMAMEGCRAFTFNADRRIKRGPNCFLKNDGGTYDANVVAIAGQIVARGEPDPGSISVSGIDPGDGMLDDSDIPGGDLSLRPAEGADNPQLCRFACVNNPSCQAFTFVKRRGACWLKGTQSYVKRSSGMVSGLKREFTFSPSRILPLN